MTKDIVHTMRILMLFFCLVVEVETRSLRGEHRKLKQSENGNGIIDQYVIQFDPTVNAKAKLRNMTAVLEGAEVLHIYNSVFKGVCLKGVSTVVLQQILDDDEVVFVEQDGILEMDYEAEETTDNSTIEETEFVSGVEGTQYLPPNWGLDRIDQRDLPLDQEYKFGNSTGRDVVVFVLDSGIRTSHSEFGGRARCSKNLVSGESCEDTRGHGTHIAASIGGTNYGVAKGVKLEAVKVIGESGATSYSNLIAGVNHVIFHRLLRFYDRTPFVMNMSVGGEKYHLLDLVTSIAANMGIVVVASSGNNAADACSYSPGSTFWAITVGSTNRDDTKSYFSNFGKCVNIFAPGDSIFSAGSRSDNAFSIRSGTSMAAPLVAGAAALYIERYPNLRAGQIRRKILEDAVEGVVQNAGYFSNNRLLQIQNLV